ncbi:branched-chain amino acid ABC transporter permease [Clostridium sp. KNHs216]|uniref:branched-chain amino acid ABC transporter permease n=1 Tax=Eubacteriales TaxID=186802 RepID=UPI001154159C|nr:branched-chain amino acid ABC transporter permease [Clostridium sp. KNHs216]TQI66103.1 branched-chain amino acid transport system permease protein [Clostridium sp. KNHs216]
MTIVVQLIISGIAMGFIYALVGIEFTLISNACDVVNFAHDKMITFGAYIFGGTFMVGLQFGFVPAILLSCIAMMLFGFAISRIIFIPLRNIPEIFTIMATILLGKIAIELCRLIWTPVPFSVPGFLSGTYRLGGFVISKANVAIIVVAMIIVIALQVFLYKTKAGKSMRCVAQNKMAAQIMGIDVKRVISLSVALSMVICGVIGILIIPLQNVATTMSDMIGLKGFAAAVIGGFGFLPGAIVGGLFCGILENICTLFIPAVYKDVISFVLLIGFLLVRPKGLTGRTR